MIFRKPHKSSCNVLWIGKQRCFLMILKNVGNNYPKIFLKPLFFYFTPFSVQIIISFPHPSKENSSWNYYLMLNIVQMNSKCIKLDKRKQKSIIMVLLTECFKIFFIKYWIGLRNLKLLLWSTLTLWHQISMSHNLNLKKKMNSSQFIGFKGGSLIWFILFSSILNLLEK